jgi:Zn-finger nucleic acid-binding protein
MKCPRCKELKLHKTHIKKVELDECHKCFGVWFDEDELRITKDKIDPDLNWMDFDIWKHEDEFKTKESSLTCPQCKSNMITVNYGNTKVEIDFCLKCKGIWLDGGELPQIIHELENELTGKSSFEYFKSTLNEAKDLFSRKESIGSNWKDLVNVARLFSTRLIISNKVLSKTTSAISNTPIK